MDLLTDWFCSVLLSGIAGTAVFAACFIFRRMYKPAWGIGRFGCAMVVTAFYVPLVLPFACRILFAGEHAAVFWDGIFSQDIGSVRRPSRILASMCGVWTVGVFLCLYYGMYRAVFHRRIRRDAVAEPEHGPYSALIEHEIMRFGISVPVHLYRSERISKPFAGGKGSIDLMIPAKGCPAKRLWLLLAGEWLWRRKNGFLRKVLCPIRIILWWNPMMGWIARELAFSDADAGERRILELYERQKQEE